MNLQNLTRPIRVDAAPGAVLPWETAYRTEPIATLEHNGANLFYIEMSPAAATRLVGKRIAESTAASTRDIDLNVLLNRAATVVRIPAAAGEEISASTMEDALREAAPSDGDALLIVTGWGDQPTEALTEERYILDAPHLEPEAVSVLARWLEERQADLLLTDLPYIERAGGAHVGAEWTPLVPWLRPSWPSPNAQAYLRHYSTEKAQADWASTLELLDAAWVVLGLVGCAALSSERALLNIAPFQVQDVGEVPCTVVAAPL